MRSLVDSRNQPVKLVGANWYGAESADFVPGGLDQQSADTIAEEIKNLHFNSVRLPFSNYIVECDPVVNPALITHLGLHGQVRALQVFDQVIAALANHGLMVILDDHSSDPTWSPDPEDTLWHVNGRYTTDQWVSDWVAMAARYRSVPAVIGADLRNEPNGQAKWASGGTEFDWRLAAERAGNAILSPHGNPQLLIMVEGTRYGVDLSGVAQHPICFLPGQQSPYDGTAPCPPSAAAGNLVYAPHDYAFSQDKDVNRSYGALTTLLGDTRGWNAAAAAAPLWIGEFGTCDTSRECIQFPANSTPSAGCANTSSGPVGTWFATFTDYVAQMNFAWAYWPLNGTESTGAPADPSRVRGADECYGLLDKRWTTPASAGLVCALQSMISPSAATYPASGCSGQPQQGTPVPQVTGPTTTTATASTPTATTTTTTSPPSPTTGQGTGGCLGVACATTNEVTLVITSVKRSRFNNYGEDLVPNGQFFVRMGVRVIDHNPQPTTVDNMHFGLLDAKHIVDSPSDEGFGSKCGLSGNGDPGITLSSGADVTMPESLCFEPHGGLNSSFTVGMQLDGGGEVDVQVPGG